MDFGFSEGQERYRQEVRDWLEAVLPRFRVGRDFAGISEAEAEDTRYSQPFSRELGAKGWIGAAWPKEFGGQGLGFIEQAIFNEEVALARAPGGYHSPAEKQMGPSILSFGTDEQKEFFIPGILAGDIGFAIGYTEPNTGSDLAGLRTSAERDGDEWVINGQKMWAGGSQFVDYLWTAVRTDPEAPKHRGVSVFLIPLKNTPGLTIRPFYSVNGARYNEVFFEDVRMPSSAIVGEVNRGWYTIAHNLDFERSGIEGVTHLRMTFDEVMTYAKEQALPTLKHPTLRRRLAETATEIEVARWMGYRVASAQSQGKSINYEASSAKLFGSELSQRHMNVYIQVLGLQGGLMRESQHAPMKGMVPRKYLASIKNTIAGGTSEIQRNIIATRGLGLPRG